MTKVTIMPVPQKGGSMAYHAVAGDRHSEGTTAGQALDALAAQLPPDEAETLVVVRQLRPDSYFTAAQQQRMSELMARWRHARDAGRTLPGDEQAELDALVEAELSAAARRASDASGEAGR